MVKEVLSNIQGVEIYPIISLSIFMIFFISLGLFVFMMSKDYVNEVSRIPLNDDDVQ